MRADIETFEASVQLFRRLGETVLKSGNTLAEELKLGGEVSLWDVVAPYETLYRFPTFVGPAANALSPQQQVFKRLLWTVRRLGAHIRNNVTPIPRGTRQPEGPRSGRQMLMFLGFTPLFYRDVLAPVVAEFRDRDDYQCIVVTHRSGGYLADLLRGGPVQQRSIYNHWDQENQAVHEAQLGRLAVVRGLARDLAEVKWPHEDIRLPVNQTLLRDELRWLFWSEFKRLIPFSICARSLITHDHPAMIITADDADQRSRAFCLTARQLGVPTLVVQQGISSIDYPEWKFFTANHIAAMGPNSREVLISQGVPPEKITVTGHPGFDCLLAPATNAIEVTRQACNIEPTQKMVLFASQPAYVGAFSSKAIRREMIRAIFGAAEEIDDIALIVKPHPSDNLREIKTLAKPFKHTSVINSKIPISKLIAACDVFVTFFSQTGIEALIAAKPVVNVRFPGSTADSYYIESGATCLAQTEEELRTMFRRLTGEERKSEMAQRENARMQLLREWTYLPDGRSSQRVRNLINNYLQEMTQQSRN